MAELGPTSASCSENQGPTILAVSFSLLAIAIITVLLRVHVRISLRSLSADDYTIFTSVIAAIIGTGCLTKLVFEGLGRHIWCLPPEQLHQALKWSTIAQIFNVVGIGLAKISICLNVLRIIDRTRTKLAIFLNVVIAFVAASHLSQIILFIVQCRPMAAIWNPHIHGKCFSPHITYLAAYIGFGLDAFTDLICAGIPIFILHRLQIQLRTKLALCCLMALGSLTAGCAIAKAILLDGVFAFDYTWALVKPAFCTIVEHLTSITLVSLPALKPLFKKLLDASSRITFSSNRSPHPHHRVHFLHRNLISPTDPKAKKSSTRSGDDDDDNMTERGEIPLCDATILKTTDFRVSSHNSVSDVSPGCNRAEDEWPLPADSVHAVGTGRAERPLGNSWRME